MTIPQWERKYGNNRPAVPPSTYSPWLQKYGFQFGLIQDYDPNQPRDDRGRWTKVGGSAGEKLTYREMENRYNKVLEGRMHTKELQSEESVYARRLSILDERENLGVPLVFMEHGQPTKHPANFLTKAQTEELTKHVLALEEKYGEPVAINFQQAPQGSNFDGWMFPEALVLNINPSILAKDNARFRHDAFLKEKEQYSVGSRRLHFGIGKYKDKLEFDENFNLGTFVSENPDYADAVRFLVQPKGNFSDPFEHLKTVVTHEYGHVVHLSSGIRRKGEIDTILDGVSDARRWLISDYARTNNNETWAEAFTMYENYPHLAEKALPGPLINYIKQLHGG